MPTVWSETDSKATPAETSTIGKSAGLAPCRVGLFRRPHLVVHHVLDVLRLHRLAARIDQRDLEPLAVRARAQTEMRLALGEPFVAPPRHGEKRQPEFVAHFRQPIFD